MPGHVHDPLFDAVAVDQLAAEFGLAGPVPDASPAATTHPALRRLARSKHKARGRGWRR